MTGMIYVNRLRRKNPEYLQQISSSDLFLISMVTHCLHFVILVYYLLPPLSTASNKLYSQTCLKGHLYIANHCL